MKYRIPRKTLFNTTSQLAYNLAESKPDRVTNLRKRKETEAYLQHDFFAALRKNGIESIPEFVDGKCRYDLLVIKRDIPVCIIEVKARPGAVRDEQIELYRKNSFGVPVLVLVGRELFEIILDEVIKLHTAKRLP
jgi:hypothetical protein